MATDAGPPISPRSWAPREAEAHYLVFTYLCSFSRHTFLTHYIYTVQENDRGYAQSRYRCASQDSQPRPLPRHQNIQYLLLTRPSPLSVFSCALYLHVYTTHTCSGRRLGGLDDKVHNNELFNSSRRERQR